MLVSADNLNEIFQILKKGAQNEKPIYIFPSLDCDSVCTTKILTSVCKQTGCRYTICPVRGWEDLQIKLTEIRPKIVDNELENLIFINCLGMNNAIKEVWGQDIGEEDFPDFHIFVFDFHRPVHLANIHSKNMVWVAETEEKCSATYPERYMEEEEEESESEDEFSESDSEGPPRKKRKLNPQVQLKRMKLKQSNEDYYRSTYCGLNSSWFLYQMATKINKDDNLMLWCGIVGLTKMFLYQEMDREEYNERIEDFQTYVLRRNNPFVEKQDEEGGITTKRKKDHIQFSNELQLIMLHHWTIYDSMFYSPIVAAKLNLWSENGRELIDYLLARMALPMKEAKQDWATVELKLKKEFYERFKKHAIETFGDDILYGSFTKQHGDHENLRAADMVFSLSALLEDEKSLREVEIEDDVYRIVENNFKASMDALDSDNTSQLAKGFWYAKNLQQTIADKALEIIHKRRISSVGFFRCVEIDEKNILYTPMAISKLSLFIQNTYTEWLRQKNKLAKPMVIGAWNDNSNTYTVCGVPTTTTRRKLNKNQFGRAFQNAAQRVDARVRRITFDTYLLEIQKDDWKKFLQYLKENTVL